MRSILAALLLLGATVTGATAGNVFTPTSGPSCPGSSKSQVNVWRCAGPGGFFAEYADEGNMVAVAIASKASPRRGAGATMTFRGSGKVFGDKLQWLVEDGKPQAAILRIWRIEVSNEGAESEVQELIVFKLQSASACQYAVVKASQPSANELAVARAREASSAACPEK
jgi:hypothetical protein